MHRIEFHAGHLVDVREQLRQANQGIARGCMHRQPLAFRETPAKPLRATRSPASTGLSGGSATTRRPSRKPLTDAGPRKITGPKTGSSATPRRKAGAPLRAPLGRSR